MTSKSIVFCFHVQAFDKARDLRNSATAQRNQIPGLQAQVDSYQQEKSRLETDLHNKRQELGKSRWRHQMETFSALLAICAGNSPVTGEFPTQRPVMRSFDVFFNLRLNKRLSKQSWGWWFEMPPCPLWQHCNGRWLHDDVMIWKRFSL